MTCPRCPTGFVIEERPFAFMRQRRCLICGYREDRTMALNRGRCRTDRPVDDARHQAEQLFASAATR